MTDLTAILERVQTRGVIARGERDELMEKHTETWVVFAEVMGDAWTDPGSVRVSSAQLADIRSRLTKIYETMAPAPGFKAKATRKISSIRSLLRWLTA